MLPKGIKTTAWPSVGATIKQLGATFEPWQEQASRAILGKDQAGLFAADAVTLSIPRQVGKTYLVGWIVIGLCLTQPKTLAVWTAHHGATAADTFRDIKAICKQPLVAPFVRHIYDSGARLEIIFANGSRIVFGAREHGFGRGFKKVGVLVFDEAQILTARAADDMVPTTNRHPNPLIFYMGTPPKPSDPSEHFLALRTEALSGESRDTLYLEFSADEGADPLDREQWAKANPSYPHHTSARAMLRMRKNLKGPNAFEREALGIWDTTGTSGVFSVGAWARLSTRKDPDVAPPAPTAPAALGIAADVDQTWLSLAVASAGETPHLGSTPRCRADTEAEHFVAEVKRIQTEHGGIPVAIDKKGPASFLIDDLRAAGVKLVEAGLDDFIQACADLRGAVETGAVEHADYTELNAAIDAAGWRTVGDRRVFGRKAGDISMLEAAALALWAIQHKPAPRLPMAAYA
ncbi:hypothetical protein [Pimelobacter simplex]|uniref:hypothetical protein n=1 Tax=Nocardioides simplex TaxID=2045 RepID=UPI00215055A3|nr:hypothetical protein [Pimelobacter simplex]UUW87410.1 hypothetical protein M0M43_16845 [Pimelobacter simplex]UUW96915.1 hypothetical protein M0M48_05490 [Pimelobacter simplex]